MTWKKPSKTILGKKVKYFFEPLEGFFGFCFPQEAVIKIDSTLKGDDLKATILHEEFHFLFFRHGINQTGIPLEVQEIIVETLSQHIIEHYHIKPK